MAWPLAPLGGEIRSSQAVAELGVANLAERPRSFDQRPGLGIGEQRLQHEAVEAVAAAAGPVGAEDRRASKGQVANSIERLVANELIRDSEGLRG